MERGVELMRNNDMIRRIAFVLFTLVLACVVIVPGRGLRGQSMERDSRQLPKAPPPHKKRPTGLLSFMEYYERRQK